MQFLICRHIISPYTGYYEMVPIGIVSSIQKLVEFIKRKYKDIDTIEEIIELYENKTEYICMEIEQNKLFNFVNLKLPT